MVTGLPWDGIFWEMPSIARQVGKAKRVADAVTSSRT
jgi:hypothetical protein